MNVTWGTCGENGSWCKFQIVNLAHPNFNGKEGVYIIWQGKGPVIRVGQGVIRDRLIEHRTNNEINSFDNLYVTWASITNQSDRDGVENFLANRLNPRVGERIPNVAPIEINLPWQY
jgi:hypothetical protein